MQTPVNWVSTAVTALQWPFIVLAAFALGRYVSKLETRVLLAEKNLKDLMERHLPHIHNALTQLNQGIEVIKTMLLSRKP